MRTGDDACRTSGSDEQIQIHGWDAAAGWFCHELVEARAESRETAAILRKLSRGSGPFQGKLRCQVRSFPSLAFQTTAYDLGDCGLVIVHLDDFTGGPIGALAIVPAHRHPRLRREFAFGLVAHLGFLNGLIAPGSESVVYHYVEKVLETEAPATIVFTLEAAQTHADVSVVLSSYLEKLSVAMLRWLRANDSHTATREHDVSAPFFFADDRLDGRTSGTSAAALGGHSE